MTEAVQQDAISVRVHEVEADSDPPCSVWETVAETSKSSWRETYGTRAEVRAFQRGVEAGCALSGGPSPEIETV